jgi:Leucine-rich repeat (LRR) protein
MSKNGIEYKDKLLMPAYNDFIVNSFPQEIWLEFARYLEPQELYALQRVAKPLMHLGGTDLLWQPLLNRVHAIDDTISTNVKPEQSIRQAFIDGFTLIKSTQQEEIDGLSAFHKKLGKKHFLKTTIHTNKTILTHLEATHGELEHFNRSLLVPVLAQAKVKALRIISFDYIGISRVPNDIFLNAEYTDLYKGVIGLSFDRNKIRKLPKSISALAALRVITFSHNFLQSLPDALGELKELRTLGCTENHLQLLPESLSKLENFQNLICNRNDLQEIPASLIYKFGTEWADMTLKDQRKSPLMGRISSLKKSNK